MARVSKPALLASRRSPQQTVQMGTQEGASTPHVDSKSVLLQRFKKLSLQL
jgi:hypothetical protein